MALLDQFPQAAEDRLRDLISFGRSFVGETVYSPAEIAKRFDLPEEFVLAIRRASGLAAAEDLELTEKDMLTYARIAEFRKAGVPDDAILETLRLFGRGMSQCAEAIVAMLSRLEDATDTGGEIEQVASDLLTGMEPVLEHALSLYVREEVRREVAGGLELPGDAAGVRPVNVAFVDMVGFTDVSDNMEVGEIGAVVKQFADMLLEAGAGKVKVVKTMGDGAMLVAPDPEPLLDSVATLIATARDTQDFPALRAGVAAGRALYYEGDWYGSSVNVASRLTAAAPPGHVLATADVRQLAGDSYDWHPAGQQHLRGVRVPVETFLL